MAIPQFTETRPDPSLGLTTEVRTVDESFARWAIARNVNNRRVQRAYVKLYADQMRAGHWCDSAQTVAFDTDGNFVDGQHRMLAVIETGLQVDMVIAWNVPKTAVATIDTGKARTAGDVLSMHNVTNAAAVAAAARWLMSYERDGFNTRHGLQRIPNADILRYVDQHPEIESAAHQSTRAYSRIGPRALFVALTVLFDRVSPDESRQFMEDLSSGEYLEKRDPVYVVRDRLLRNRQARHRAGAVEMAAWVVKAWNARRAHRPLVHLKHVPGKWEFPKIL